MSKCDISIELDDPQGAYYLGDTVTGTVKILVNKDVNCSALKITGLWKTHGRGNTDRGKYGEHTAFEGIMKAGEVKTIPFNILVEGVPLTYRGEYLNIDHYVDVRIDIPWSLDPKASEEFLVLAEEGDCVLVVFVRPLHFQVEVDEGPVEFEARLFEELKQQEPGNVEHPSVMFCPHGDQVHSLDAPLSVNILLMHFEQIQ